MSTIYLVTLIAVSTIVLGVLLDAVISVSRKPTWSANGSKLHLVPTLDRRTQDLPFVGVDPRRANAPVAAPQADEIRHIA